MSYDHQRIDLQVGTAISVTTTGVKTNTPPGGIPIVVRQIAALIRTAPTVTPTVVTVKRRPTPGSATAEVTLGTLTLPTSAAVGNLYYKPIIVTSKILPGEELVFDVTTASTAGVADFIATVDPSWENPGNIPKMILSA